MSIEEENNKCQFYNKAKNYWSEIPATVNGMLGGFEHISQADIQGSRQFLSQIFKASDPPNKHKALDCGAGIGRVTQNLLSTVFSNVDLVEQNPIFLEEAKVLLSSKSDKIGEYFPLGLQEFKPAENKYDVIWTQWVLGHLTDVDLINFFKSCKLGLTKNGIIVVKENISSSGDVEMDDKDSSVTRPYSSYIDIFEAAGLQCIKKQKQTGFPKAIYPVYMFALKG